MRTGPSLRVVSGRYGTANLPDMHDETIAAIIEGDAARAAQAIRTDILQGLGQIKTALKE
jgi:DNA-binding GntR family transcriptional regulator